MTKRIYAEDEKLSEEDIIGKLEKRLQSLVLCNLLFRETPRFVVKCYLSTRRRAMQLGIDVRGYDARAINICNNSSQEKSPEYNI